MFGLVSADELHDVKDARGACAADDTSNARTASNLRLDAHDPNKWTTSTISITHSNARRHQATRNGVGNDESCTTGGGPRARTAAASCVLSQRLRVLSRASA
ncbi:uncharacterized protein SCHCODRAFT_02696009 [Schizophyllum commune H4-8]|nr:uncharacterized protein SCHCODRAFT_02696009 [Schizophyllum commune H4-8]KAI5900857.1 hypothetical protein SCHCODRAFT_02696009 [Schizophyllum commune H4-8]